MRISFALVSFLFLISYSKSQQKKKAIFISSKPHRISNCTAVIARLNAPIPSALEPFIFHASFWIGKTLGKEFRHRISTITSLKTSFWTDFLLHRPTSSCEIKFALLTTDFKDDNEMHKVAVSAVSRNECDQFEPNDRGAKSFENSSAKLSTFYE